MDDPIERVDKVIHNQFPTQRISNKKPALEGRFRYLLPDDLSTELGREATKLGHQIVAVPYEIISKPQSVCNLPRRG